MKGMNCTQLRGAEARVWRRDGELEKSRGDRQGQTAAPRDQPPLTIMHAPLSELRQLASSYPLPLECKWCRGPPSSPSFSLSIRTFFRATISSVWVSRARSGREVPPQ